MPGLDNIQRGRQRGEPLRHAARAPQHRHARSARAPYDQHRAIQRLRVRQQFGRRITPRQYRRRGTQFFGQLDHGQNPIALRRTQALQLRRLHIGRVPVHIELACQTRGRANGLLGAQARADARQNGARRVPDRLNRLQGAVAAHVVFDMFGGTPERDFAQRNQVAFSEKVFRSALCLLRHVHLAGLQPEQQLIGRHIDQNHFVGVVQHGVGHGFIDANTSDGADRAVKAFEVLHIERRPHVDAGFQQLLHVLPAFGVT